MGSAQDAVGDPLADADREVVEEDGLVAIEQGRDGHDRLAGGEFAVGDPDICRGGRADVAAQQVRLLQTLALAQLEIREVGLPWPADLDEGDIGGDGLRRIEDLLIRMPSQPVPRLDLGE